MLDSQIDSWDILPNTGVGFFHIHDNWQKIVDFMNLYTIPYSIVKNRVFCSVKTDNMIIAFDKNKQVYAITVFNCFGGKVNYSIGIGSTLSDVKKELGEYKDGMNAIYPTYELTLIPGIEFKLSDDDIYDSIDDIMWDESQIPIAEITVWDDKTWNCQVNQHV